MCELNQGIEFPACNATFHGLELFKDHNNKLYALIHLRATDLPIDIKIAVAEIDKIKLECLNDSLLFFDENGNSTIKKARTFLKSKIFEAISDNVYKKILFTQMGWHKLENGSKVYVAGDCVIGDLSEDNYIISSELSGFSFVSNQYENENDLIRYFFENIYRDPYILLPIVAFNIRSSLNSWFNDLGYPLKFLLYLSGKQGCGKTTAALDFGMCFNSNATNEPAFTARALSSQAAIRDFIASTRDTCILLDDICTSSDSATKRKVIALAGFTIRFAADRIPVKMKARDGNFIEKQNQAGVIITGEFPMTEASDLSRCVIVDVDHQMTNKTRQDRIITSESMSFFLKYCAENADWLNKEISESLSNFDAACCKDSSPRMQQHLGESELAFNLLIEYAHNINALDDDEYKNLQKLNHNVFEKCLGNYNKLLREYNTCNFTNIASNLLELIDTDSFSLAKNKNLFNDKYDGFTDKKHIMYIKLSAITRELSRQTGKVLTDNNVGNMLRKAGIVEVSSDNHTATAKFPKIGRFVPLDKKMLKG